MMESRCVNGTRVSPTFRRDLVGTVRETFRDFLGNRLVRVEFDSEPGELHTYHASCLNRR